MRHGTGRVRLGGGRVHRTGGAARRGRGKKTPTGRLPLPGAAGQKVGHPAGPKVKERRQMTGRVEGKVAFITGAARGQGRSHAVRLAQEGADIIAVDLCDQVDSVPYQMATPEDLADTVKQVEALDRRIVATKADVRDYGALKAALDDGVAQLGHLDIVSANAGIFIFGTMEELDETHWQDM